jgi:glutamate/tyrosine decarboxylase-like PLP-dependent enzyme
MDKAISLSALLSTALQRSTRYLQEAGSRRVSPTPADVERLSELGGPLAEEPSDPERVLGLLDDIGSPATVINVGGRYFGFVNGGSLPAALAAEWLASAWDQNAGPGPCSPTAAALEAITIQWTCDLLGLPPGTGGSLVTGASMANFCGLAAARHALLRKQGWNVERDGLFGAPPITVVVGEEVHVALLKALSLLGFGSERVVRVPCDKQGRMDARKLPSLSPSSIVCIQAGNVNTGAIDPARAVCEAALASDAWVHVDGAFGLWALAAPRRAPQAQGMELAHSWATDAHKWLNVPYDCGIVLVRDPKLLEAAMSTNASYLAQGPNAHPFRYTPEMSRRARSVPLWAAFRSLGRSGVAELIERCCRHAERFADGLRRAGYEVLNDVMLNQVLVSFGAPDVTNKVIAEIQRDGTCWCGGTIWQGHTAMRISVSSWATTDEDVDRSLQAILGAASRVTGRGVLAV